jgi:hypothetical protein
MKNERQAHQELEAHAGRTMTINNKWLKPAPHRTRSNKGGRLWGYVLAVMLGLCLTALLLAYFDILFA